MQKKCTHLAMISSSRLLKDVRHFGSIVCQFLTCCGTTQRSASRSTSLRPTAVLLKATRQTRGPNTHYDRPLTSVIDIASHSGVGKIHNWVVVRRRANIEIPAIALVDSVDPNTPNQGMGSNRGDEGRKTEECGAEIHGPPLKVYRPASSFYALHLPRDN